MTLGEKIKAERKRCGLSQADVAQACGISRQSVFKYENGIITNIPLGKLEKLASVFHISTAQLLSNEDKPKTPPLFMNRDSLTPEEMQLIYSYRAHPELRDAVKKLLDFGENSDTVTLFVAASSEDNIPPRYIKMDKKRWEMLKNAPETGEKL